MSHADGGCAVKWGGWRGLRRLIRVLIVEVTITNQLARLAADGAAVQAARVGVTPFVNGVKRLAVVRGRRCWLARKEGAASAGGLVKANPCSHDLVLVPIRPGTLGLCGPVTNRR